MIDGQMQMPLRCGDRVAIRHDKLGWGSLPIAENRPVDRS